MSATTSGSLPAATTNPNTCGIMGLLQTGGAFSSSVLGEISSAQSQVTATIASLQGIPGALQQSLALDVGSITTTLQGVASGAMANLTSHVTQALGSMVNNLSLAASHLTANLGLMSSGCSLPAGSTSANPCDGMQAFFGSLMGAGSAAIGQISSALGNISASLDISALTGAVNSLSSSVASEVAQAQATIASAMSAINGAVGQIEGVAANITGMINAEVSQLTNALTDMTNFAFSNMLPSLFQNQCAQMVLNSVATPALMSHLGS